MKDKKKNVASAKQPINQTTIDPNKQKAQTVKSDETKKDDTKKMFAYVGIVFFVCLLFVPSVIRLLDPNYEEGGGTSKVKERVIKLHELRCQKTTSREQYTLIQNITTKYEDDISTSSEIVYDFQPNDGNVNADLEILPSDLAEYNELSKVNQPGMEVSSDTKNKYIVYMDFKENVKLKNIETTGKHSRKLDSQSNNYQESGFSCQTMDAGEETVKEEA